MAILHVRNIPEPLYERVQKMATDRGQTLSSFILALLEREAADETRRKQFAITMNEIRANMEMRKRDWPTNLPNAVDLINEGREERERQLSGESR